MSESIFAFDQAKLEKTFFEGCLSEKVSLLAMLLPADLRRFALGLTVPWSMRDGAINWYPLIVSALCGRLGEATVRAECAEDRLAEITDVTTPLKSLADELSANAEYRDGETAEMAWQQGQFPGLLSDLTSRTSEKGRPSC
jgi:hypothetical protein